VTTHKRLQQFVPLEQACPSTLQFPDPLPLRPLQVPDREAEALLQRPVQQSLAVKQTSPTELQAAPDVVQRPP
jgi:hypothetical protein